MKIDKKLIAKNHTEGRSGARIEYIVIHDTGNNSKGANAEAHYRYFDRENRNASAHYFVDDHQILQVVDDMDTAWHCGKLYGNDVNAPQCKNKNSIGVEMCINADGNYEKAFENTIELTKHLMKKYHIDDTHVIRHYDACKKMCPASFSQNNWKKWKEFKTKLKHESPSDTHDRTDTISNSIKAKNQVFIINQKQCVLPVLELDGYNYIKVRTIADAIGLQVDYNAQKNIIKLK